MPLQAREIENIFKQRGSDAGALYCLQQIADDCAQLRQMLLECASAIDKFAELATTAAIITQKQHGANMTAQARNKLNPDYDVPEINPHDRHDDEGVNMDPEKWKDE